MALEFIIPLAPVTKKNSQRICTSRSGRPFIMPSAKFTEYEKAAGWYLPRTEETITGPVNVKALFYMPTLRRVDLVNLEEALLDVLVTHRIIADDNSMIVVSMDGSRVLYDKGRPRTEVFIEEV